MSDRKGQIVTKEILEQEYLINRRKVTEIAQLLGVHISTVYSGLYRYEIPMEIANKRNLDLSGRQVNELLVIEYVKNKGWLCKCSCGKEIYVIGSRLANNQRYSCGCKRRCEPRNEAVRNPDLPNILKTHYIDEDMSTEEIGELLHMSTSTIYKCLHEFGIPLKLFKGEDLKGQRFGLLTITDFIPSQGWLCKCDCGNSVTIPSPSKLLKGRISCGCVVNRKTMVPGYGDIVGSFWTAIKTSAFKRGLAFEISIEYAWELYLQQNRLCVYSGLPIKFAHPKKRPKEQTASLDRVDNTKPYIKGNVCWTHKIFNLLKRTLSSNDFIAACRLVANYTDDIEIIDVNFDTIKLFANANNHSPIPLPAAS